MTREYPTHRNLMSRHQTHRQAELFRSYYQLVRRVALQHGARESDADDLAQRVFLIVFGKLANIRTGSEWAYVRAVTIREAGHLRRTYARRAEVDAEALGPRSTGAPRLDDRLHRHRVLSSLLNRLGRLAETVRGTWWQHEVDGWSAQRIAEVEGVPVGTVKSRLLRARRELRAAHSPDSARPTAQYRNGARHLP